MKYWLLFDLGFQYWLQKNENRLKIDVKRIKKESKRGFATKIKSLQIQILMVRMSVGCFHMDSK